MKVAVCILAKNEERTIAKALRSIWVQYGNLAPGSSMKVVVVANGCTDATAARARAEAMNVADPGFSIDVLDLPEGGKSRSWNRAVHEFIPDEVDDVFFMDADVSLLRPNIFSDMIKRLRTEPAAKIVSGHPVKDVAISNRKSLIDRFSLAVSRRGRFADAVNGSLYLATSKTLRKIWLPDDTPGEDGFLNAMVTTNGFTQSPRPGVVRTMDEPTHLFSTHSVSEYFAHERRMIIATTINRWVFEYLWSLNLTEPAGPLIARWNKENASWVEAIIRERSAGKNWLVPKDIMLGRLRRLGEGGLARRVAYLPVALGATLLTVPPAVSSNRRLKKVGAAKTW